MTFHTNVLLATIEAAAVEGTAALLTEGTIVTVNPERFDALRHAGLLALIDDGIGGTCWGIERDYDDMVTCVIADCSAFAERVS